MQNLFSYFWEELSSMFCMAFPRQAKIFPWTLKFCMSKCTEKLCDTNTRKLNPWTKIIKLALVWKTLLASSQHFEIWMFRKTVSGRESAELYNMNWPIKQVKQISRTLQSGWEFCHACLLLLETSRNCRDSQPERGGHFSQFGWKFNLAWK